MSKILITGGAGFIGTALVNRLYKKHDITVYDNLHQQVHGSNPTPETEKAELIVGDVRNTEDFKKVLKDKEIIIHLAAETGTAQSMQQIQRCIDVNTGGMAILCDYIRNSTNQVFKVILASSRAVYGEGEYYCSQCIVNCPEKRQLSKTFGIICSECGNEDIVAIATKEEALLNPTSVYGITKQTQEQLLNVSTDCSIILRLQNVYGEGESLINKHKGILVFFAQQALKNEPIEIYEDGEMIRDFVYIEDVVDAFESSINIKENNFTVNIGSGIGIKLAKVAKRIVDYYDSKSSIILTGKYRDGDIKNNYADISKAKELLDFKPKYKIEDKLPRLLDWVRECAT